MCCTSSVNNNQSKKKVIKTRPLFFLQLSQQCEQNVKIFQSIRCRIYSILDLHRIVHYTFDWQDPMCMILQLEYMTLIPGHWERFLCVSKSSCDAEKNVIFSVEGRDKTKLLPADPDFSSYPEIYPHIGKTNKL